MCRALNILERFNFLDRSGARIGTDCQSVWPQVDQPIFFYTLDDPIDRDDCSSRAGCLYQLGMLSSKSDSKTCCGYDNDCGPV